MLKYRRPRRFLRLMLCHLILCVVSLFFLGSFDSEAVTAGEPSSRPISFELDVLPILTAAGCNAGACHGKARGQNGFQLSLLGFDPNFDYDSLTKHARGRRVFPASPPASLLLRKATAAAPHGGGRRLIKGSPQHQTLLAWIAQGTPRRIPQEPSLVQVEIEPAEQLLKPKQTLNTVVRATYSDGSTRDVTRQTTFQSNDAPIAAVEETGVITAGPIPGETAIMARYMGHIAVCRVLIPLPQGAPPELFDKLPQQNFIDALVWKKLRTLGIAPSAGIDDAKFMRRVHLDLIGRLPTPGEVRRFLADSDPQKRERLVDDLLERPEYADFWANKWADFLRPNPYRVGIKAVFNYDNWIREQFRRNEPYDRFVYKLLTAQGSTWRNGAATLFRDRRSPDEIATLVSQLFLGIRLECAKCHHHPFEKWGQDDFYSFAAYFARVGRKGTGLSPPISGGEEIVQTAKRGRVRHPLTGETLPPRPLFGRAPEIKPGDDLRRPLADWLTSKNNKFFAMVMVNRVWADLMGRGLVEPVDDLRATNPASNEPLLSALAEEFQRLDFDLKKLLKTIASSYVYSLSSLPSQNNAADTRNYSRHYRRRMRAEVLLDAASDITGSPVRFSAMPAGSRAMQVWTHRVSSLFLDTFGRPDPNQDPPCERSAESTVTQALHLMNSPQLHRMATSDSGRAAKLAAGEMSADAIVEELYLSVYGRFPQEKERAIGRRFFASSQTSRRRATEDLLWALLNTPEFFVED